MVWLSDGEDAIRLGNCGRVGSKQEVMQKRPEEVDRISNEKSY